ncbi:MAG TPA: hypothetical protein VNJ08_00520 [Bacteriovoracaceae bacterium]|nr:hypothetical protein [Bacteriovoracaceae bacterium]
MKYLLVFFLISCASEKTTTPTKRPVVAENHNFQIITLDNMNEFEGSILQYVMNAPELKKDLSIELQKNRVLCKQGNNSNCDAIEQNKKDRENLYQGLIDITWVKGCSTHAAIQDRKSLTRKDSPQLIRELKIYTETYKRETGKELNLNKCE